MGSRTNVEALVNMNKEKGRIPPAPGIDIHDFHASSSDLCSYSTFMLVGLVKLEAYEHRGFEIPLELMIDIFFYGEFASNGHAILGYKEYAEKE
ncbi:hypothetical protein SLE2022_128960 [Rubroshorea leprosula]